MTKALKLVGVKDMVNRKLFGKSRKGKTPKTDKVLAKLDSQDVNPPKGIAVGKTNLFKRK